MLMHAEALPPHSCMHACLQRVSRLSGVVALPLSTLKLTRARFCMQYRKVRRLVPCMLLHTAPRSMHKCAQACEPLVSDFLLSDTLSVRFCLERIKSLQHVLLYVFFVAISH